VRFGLLARLARLARAKFPEGHDGDIQFSLMVAREIASPAYPFGEAAAREWIERRAAGHPARRRPRPARAAVAGHRRRGPRDRQPSPNLAERKVTDVRRSRGPPTGRQEVNTIEAGPTKSFSTVRALNGFDLTVSRGRRLLASVMR
jgi:hypothetical protein